MAFIFCGKRVAHCSYCKNIAYIFMILWGYVLIWYSCGVRGIDVKKINEGIRCTRRGGI